MTLLDTNVVSAVMSRSPDRAVIEWLNRQDASSLFISTITIAEIGYGLWVLPDGKRRRNLEERFERFVHQGFDQRVLAFDERSARIYPQIVGHRRALGRSLSALDGQIASIARANLLAVATRNVKDFDECGIEVLNPFA